MRAGRPVEDDRIEIKRDWPGPERARQLAGAANALRGEPLIYIVGCDEDGETHPVRDVDPTAWYGAIRAGFDSDAPRLALHVRVVVGDDPGDSVVALLFETDGFPYVIPVANVSDRREVPIRVASGTASANRSQLLRVLGPTLAAPPSYFSDVEVSARLYDMPAFEGPPGSEGRPARSLLTVSVQATVFIEYLGSQSVSVPIRTVRSRIAFPTLPDVWPLAGLYVRQLGDTLSASQSMPAPPTIGVHARNNFIIATGPGEFGYSGSQSREVEPAERHELLSLSAAMEQATELPVELRMQFVGVDRPTYVSAVAHMNPDPIRLGPDAWARRWALRREDGDAW